MKLKKGIAQVSPIIFIPIYTGCFIALFSTTSLTQQLTFQREVDTIPVVVNGMPVSQPFGGALFLFSRPTFADIDNDGDFDLFIGDFNGTIKFHRNIGTAANPIFKLEENIFASIDVGSRSVPALVDIDNDSDLDLFVSGNSLNFYRNTGSKTNPKFTLETNNFASIVVGVAFTFADIDNDFDLDLFIGRSSGLIRFYRNTGTVTEPTFALETEDFLSFDAGTNISPVFADIDNDGDLDLFVGEFSGNICFFRNIGSATNPNFIFVTDKFLPIDVRDTSHPAFVDIDNDRDLDLFVGKNNGNVDFYRNTGNATNPVFILVTESLVYLSIESTSDLYTFYTRSVPTFFDTDNDRDLDLFVGESNGNINFYRNIGTASNPAFSFITEKLDFIDVGEECAPSFTDIDNDGDGDLFVGERNGNINFYQNTGTATNSSFILETENFASIDVGNDSAPTFVDIDNDGDLDLFVGEGSSSHINFYKNIGTPTNPTFIFETEKFISNVGIDNHLAFADLDNDGDYDLFIGGDSGGFISFYRNTGTASNSNFILETSNFFSILFIGTFGYTTPHFADIDRDGDFDLFVGERGGGLIFYRNITPIPNIRISNTSLSFGSVSVGNSKNHSLKIFNDGNALLAISRITSDNPVFSVVRSSFDVNSNSSIEVTVSFSPTTIGLQNGLLKIISNDPDDDSLTVSVTGNGAIIPQIRVPTTSLSFGNIKVGSTKEQNLTIFNDGSAVLMISSITSNNLNFSATPTSLNVDPKSSAGIKLIFQPATEGPQNGVLTIISNDPEQDTLSIAVSGTGNRRPVVANAIPNITLTVGGPRFIRDLNTFPVVFNDSDGDTLTYSANSSNGNTAIAITQGSIITVTPVAVGNATIMVTANDGKAGPVSTTFSVIVNSDQTAPQILHSPISSATSGQNQTISATLTDNVGIQSAKLFHRRGGESAFDSTAMIRTSGDNYLGTILASFITERGTDYYFSVRDTAGNRATYPTTNPQTKPQSIQVANSNLAFAIPTPAKSYRMISVPFDLTDKSVANVLADDFGSAYDDKQWRLLRYVNGANVEFGTPGFASFDFKAGLGFWLITRDAKILDAGAGRSVTTSQNYIITLPSGWSQIGDPFAFTVNWSDVIKGANIEDKLVGYQGSLNEATGYDYNRTQLVPFEGYFVNNKGSSPTTIEIPPKAATGSAAAKQLTGWQPVLQSKEWALQITAACERYLDKDNYLGALNDASDEWDVNDFSEAPFFDQHVALYFPHPEWKKYPDLYTGDFRAVKSEGDYWDFVVKSEVAKSEVAKSEVVLKLAEVQNVPADWEVILLDKASRVAINFSEKKQYTFPSGNGKTMREFRIVVGKKDFVETNDLNLSGVPQAFALGQNYPNPFWSAATSRFAGNPSTRIDYELPITSHVKISVYNLSGQLVRMLFDGEQSAGRYTVAWDGTNAGGNRVASGVYLVRMEAGRFVNVRKMVLTR